MCKTVVVSVGGVLGLQYARTRTVGSELFRSSQTMRLTDRGEGWCHKLRSEVRFLVEGNSPSSFAARVILAEKNVTWEINFMAFEFVMQPCLSYSHYINVAKAGKVIELVKFDHEGTCVEHGNTQLSCCVLAVGLGAGTWIMNGSQHRLRR